MSVSTRIARAALSVSRQLPIAIAAPLRMLPWDSRVIGPPRGIVDTKIGKWGEVRRLQSETLEIDISCSVEPGIAAAFEREIPTRIIHPHVSLLRNGRVSEPGAAIITDSDEVAEDLCRPFGGPAKSHPVFGRLMLPRVRRVPGTVGVLHGLRTDNYFHWLFEALGRLAFLRAAGVECGKYLVHAPDDVRMRSLEALGVTSEECISPNDCPHIQADNLATPSRLPSGLVPPSVVRFLRKNFARDGGSHGWRRIYVSRQRARRRRMLHGDEIERVLREFDFEVVECERLSFQEQIATFCGAAIIVAPHGAGLSNIAFCPKGAAVLECFASTYVNPCYASVAAAAGLRYSAIADGPVDPTRRAVHGRDDIALRGEVLRRELMRIIG